MITHSLSSGIRGIVLDAVGTLIDPSPSVAAAYVEAARRQGVALDPAIVRTRFHQHFGRDEIDEARGPLTTDEATERRRWRRIVAGVLPEVPDPAGAFAELWAHFGRPTSWRAFPDVAPALEALESAGLAIAVASNFDARLRPVLAGLPELSPWSEAAVISSEIGYRKPHPEFYRAACARLGLAPGCVLCVGDDPENDLQGPRRIGARSLLVDRDDRGGGEGPRIRDLAGLVDWIRCSADPGRPDCGS
jgi:putative hydrolase of the HAD superfamily